MLELDIQVIVLDEGADVLTKLSTFLRIISQALVKKSVVAVIKVLNGQLATTLLIRLTGSCQVEMRLVVRIKLSLQTLNSLLHLILFHNVKVVLLIELLKEQLDGLELVAGKAVDDLRNTGLLKQCLHILVCQLVAGGHIDVEAVRSLFLLGLTGNLQCIRLSEASQGILSVLVLLTQLGPQCLLTLGNLLILCV